MAKRERNKRSARKARQQERERVAAAQAIAEASQPKKKKLVKKSAGKPAAKKAAISKADRRGVQKVTGYFSDVRAEMHQVTWPTRIELRNYSVAVIISLIIFGLFVWLVDTGFVAGLVQYVGLRG